MKKQNLTEQICKNIEIYKTKLKFNTSNLEEVLSLPVHFRWYASTHFLSPHELEVARLCGVRKYTPQCFSKFLTNIAENAVRRLAYQVADFGRHQYTHIGRNVLPSDVGIRTEYGERYNFNYRSTDLYADYFFAASDRDDLMYLILLPNGDDKPKKISFFDLPIGRQVINNKTYDFIYNMPLFKRAGLEFCKEVCSLKFKEYEYHIDRKEAYMTLEDNNKLILNIIKEFQNVKRIDKINELFSRLNLDEIVVTENDGIIAGICPSGIRGFLENYFKKEIENKTPITAAMVWEKRSDHLAKNAILAAYKRMKNNS